MTLTIEEKIKIVEEKILEVERTIRYTKNPSQEEIDAQILTGIREHIINQVAQQTKVIEVLNITLNNLKSSISQIP
jgi:tRNA-binding EMAP/Myf-like protein